MAKFINVTKQIFFDRDRIIRAMDAKTRTVLAKTGGFTRLVMKRAMRKVTKKRNVSQPGEYPLAHEGTLRRLIFFGYDLPSKSLVVGPTLFKGKRGSGSTKTVPELVNYGGVARRMASTGRVVQHYRPRPFVALTMPAAIRVLRENMATVEFK